MARSSLGFLEKEAHVMRSVALRESTREILDEKFQKGEIPAGNGVDLTGDIYMCVSVSLRSRRRIQWGLGVSRCPKKGTVADRIAAKRGTGCGDEARLEGSGNRQQAAKLK